MKRVWIGIAMALVVITLILLILTVVSGAKPQGPQETESETVSITVNPPVTVPDLPEASPGSEDAEETGEAAIPKITLDEAGEKTTQIDEAPIDRDTVVLPRLEEPEDEGK